MNMNLCKLWELAKDREAWCTIVYWVTNNQTANEQQQNRDKIQINGCQVLVVRGGFFYKGAQDNSLR